MNVVDLPGYGFAFANEENQKQWQDTVSVCFKSHPRLVFVPVSLCWCAPVCMHVCVCVCVASFFFSRPTLTTQLQSTIVLMPPFSAAPLWCLQMQTRTYLSQRLSLKRIFLLLDARHGLKQIDFRFMRELEQITTARFQFVFTKCDLVPLDDLCRRIILLKKVCVCVCLCLSVCVCLCLCLCLCTSSPLLLFQPHNVKTNHQQLWQAH